MHSSNHEQFRDERTSKAIVSGIDPVAHSGTRRGPKASLPPRKEAGAKHPFNTPSPTPQPQSRRSSGSSTQGKSEQGFAAVIVRHQIPLSLGLLASLGAAHGLLPSQREFTRKFYSVSYYNAADGQYFKGTDDGYIVVFWIVLFTFLRAFAIDYILTPMAKLGGITSRKGIVRFTEQGWMMVYYIVFWAIGMHLVYNSPYWMDLPKMWTDWPLRGTDWLHKWYYLVQFAFWLQQIVVLHIEERRKDHYQMLAHHIITCSLMAGSYAYHLTRVGNVILCIMDFVDILLPAAKILKYLGYNTLCDYAFGIFLVSWVALRHFVFNRVVYSAWADAKTTIGYACYTSNSTTPLPIPKNEPSAWSIQNTMAFDDDFICFTKPVHMSFIWLLVALQVITLAWLYMILRVAYRVVKGAGADDTRSDDEDTADEADEEELNEAGVDKVKFSTAEKAQGVSQQSGGHARHILKVAVGGS